MSTPDEIQPTPAPDPDQTYPVDPEHAAELTRLMLQDRIVTECMGGLFPEGQTILDGGRLLDLACGPGGWALEVAFAYPTIEVIGVDISQQVIEYARAQAWSRGLDNAHFFVNDITRSLDFPDHSFDLINGRFLCIFMRPEAWPLLLAECRRLLKPGGTIRLTEGEPPVTTSAAFQTCWRYVTQALKLAGQSFSVDGYQLGITPLLPRLVRQAGFVDLRLRSSSIECSSGTPAHYSFFKDFFIALELVQPFLVKLGIAPSEELERLYQQAVAEMQQEDFCAVGHLLTVCGQQPESVS